MSSYDELTYHRPIEFDVLKQTKKAVLIRVSEIYSAAAEQVLTTYGPDLMEPVELWIPKSWFKIRQCEEGSQAFIWEKGFVANLKKLGATRAKNLTPSLPEGVTLH